MTVPEIARQRLHNQRITQGKISRPGEVVAWLGAMQAQDYPSARWAVGLRCKGATNADIELAVAERAFLRTWLLRGTLHLVPPGDIRWVLELLRPRLISQGARRNQQLELDAATFSKGYQVLTQALQGGRRVIRNEIMGSLEKAGISTAGQRGYHILQRAALEGVICFGPNQGKQPTFVLLDEWSPKGRRLEHDEALAELAARYFLSHGPATLADFTWWSGLGAVDARVALELAKAQLVQESMGGQAYWLRPDQAMGHDHSLSVRLLPAFDEYYLGYTERSAVLDPRFDRQLVSSNGVFRPMLVIDGQVVGMWKQELSKRSVTITIKLFKSLSREEQQAIVPAAERYGAFLGLPVILE